jgi:hypothetical protein
MQLIPKQKNFLYFGANVPKAKAKSSCFIIQVFQNQSKKIACFVQLFQNQRKNFPILVQLFPKPKHKIE